MQNENKIFGGRYRLVETIGHGATGLVYRVQDIRLFQNYAMKETVTTMLNEAELLKRIDHVLFPRVDDWFVENGKSYLVTEYIDGISLEEQTPTLSDVLEWGICLAQGLSYLHHLQPPIIHQDIKPSNILIKKSGQIKLIDFGIAIELRAGEKREKAYGSYGFAAPEQFGDKNGTAIYPVDERTDIFGLGKTLEYLVGDRKNCRRWRALNRIIGKCIRKDAKRRYQNADILLHDLNSLKISPRKKSLLLITAMICLLCLCCFIMAGASHKKQGGVAASNFINNSTWRKEGLEAEKAIESSAWMQEPVMQFALYDELLYQAGYHCFHEEQDYKGALQYFKQISVETYKETSYYVTICNQLSDANVEQASLQNNLMIFISHVCQQTLSVDRMEVLLDLCNLYNFAGEEKTEALLRTEPILSEGLRSITLLQSRYTHDEIWMTYLNELMDEYYFCLFLINRQIGIHDEKLKPQAYQKAITYGKRVILKNELSVEETEAVFCQLAQLYVETNQSDRALQCYAEGERCMQNSSANLYASYLACLQLQYEAATDSDKHILSQQLHTVYERAVLLNEEGHNQKLSAVIRRLELSDSITEDKEEEEHN